MKTYELSLIGYVGAGNKQNAEGLLIGSINRTAILRHLLGSKSEITHTFERGVHEYKVTLFVKVTAQSEPLAIQEARTLFNLPLSINVVVNKIIKGQRRIII